MTYYRKHLFFCLNQRDGERKCCNNAGATAMRAYAKQRIKDLGLAGQGGVRVNIAGCLGRCSEGPSLVVYPEGVWYRYTCKQDIDEIINRHIIHGEVVKHLLMDGPEPAIENSSEK